jgi:hypothetical protein
MWSGGMHAFWLTRPRMAAWQTASPHRCASRAGALLPLQVPCWAGLGNLLAAAGQPARHACLQRL